MVDYINILIGVLVLILGIILLFYKWAEVIDGPYDKYGDIYKSLTGSLGLIMLGIALIIREVLKM